MQLCIRDFVIKLYRWHVLWNWHSGSACGYVCHIRMNKYECSRNKEGCALRYSVIVIVWSVSSRIVALNYCEMHPVVSRAIYRVKFFVYTALSVLYSYMSCLHRCEWNLFVHIPSFQYWYITTSQSLVSGPVVRGELKFPASWSNQNILKFYSEHMNLLYLPNIALP